MTGQQATAGAAARDLVSLVELLPETYQPIYGHLEIESSRTPHGPRIDAVVETVELLSRTIGRPLRVLDLGCAQGYTACLLAAEGHHVTGIDFLPANVEVCQAIAGEHRQLDLKFLAGDVGDLAQLVHLSSYDVVLGLSVMHHVAHRDGHSAAVSLISGIAAEVPHAIYEMALAGEPLYWADALPRDPRVTLASYAFIRQVASSPTHLSDLRRPVLFCSQRLALVAGALQPIRSWSTRAHSQSTAEQRAAMRYYVLPTAIAKVLSLFDAEVSSPFRASIRDEMRREAYVLPALHAVGFDVPEVLEFTETDDETVLVRGWLPGQLLSDIVETLTEHERVRITQQVLDQLSAFEQHALYHTDLRLWNVLYDREEQVARLIDLGSLRTRPVDVVWPEDAHYSALLFLVALWRSRPDQTGMTVPRTLTLDDAPLPARVVELIRFLLAHDDDECVFQHAAERWKAGVVRSYTGVWPPVPLAWNWLVHVERRRAAAVAESVNDRANFSAEMKVEQAARVDAESQLEAARANAAQLEVVVAALTADLDSTRAAFDDLDAQRVLLCKQIEAEQLSASATQDALQSYLQELRTQLELTDRHVELIHRTLSWRVTRPLRGLRHVAVRVKAAFVHR